MCLQPFLFYLTDNMHGFYLKESVQLYHKKYIFSLTFKLYRAMQIVFVLFGQAFASEHINETSWQRRGFSRVTWLLGRRTGVFCYMQFLNSVSSTNKYTSIVLGWWPKYQKQVSENLGTYNLSPKNHVQVQIFIRKYVLKHNYGIVVSYCSYSRLLSLQSNRDCWFFHATWDVQAEMSWLFLFQG